MDKVSKEAWENDKTSHIRVAECKCGRVWPMSQLGKKGASNMVRFCGSCGRKPQKIEYFKID